MSWDRIIGQHRIKQLLRQAVSARQVAHAYLFVGPEGVGKDALALEFAAVLNCQERGVEACGTCTSCRQMATLQHPNVHLVHPLPVGKGEEKGDDPLDKLQPAQIEQIQEQLALKAGDPYHRIDIERAFALKINSIRDLRRKASLSGAAEAPTVFVIMNAETMSDEASNSLLKTLEEPLKNTVLLLTAMDRDALLATIVSRCQLMQCDLLLEDEIAEALILRDGADPTQARLAAQMSNGSYGVARALLSADVQAQRAETVDYLRMLLRRNKTDLVAIIDRVASSYERPELGRWLRLLGIWLHDALIYREKGALPSVGDVEDLKRFVARFPQADLQAALASVERAIAHLNKFVYLHLILTQLAIELRGHITGQAPS